MKEAPEGRGSGALAARRGQRVLGRRITARPLGPPAIRADCSKLPRRPLLTHLLPNSASSAGVRRRPAPRPPRVHHRRSASLTAMQAGRPGPSRKAEVASSNESVKLGFHDGSCDSKITVPSPCKA